MFKCINMENNSSQKNKKKALKLNSFQLDKLKSKKLNEKNNV